MTSILGGNSPTYIESEHCLFFPLPPSLIPFLVAMSPELGKLAVTTDRVPFPFLCMSSHTLCGCPFLCHLLCPSLSIPCVNRYNFLTDLLGAVVKSLSLSCSPSRTAARGMFVNMSLLFVVAPPKVPLALRCCA